MVLIKGLNYDISNQQKTFLTGDIHSGDTVLFVDNTAGFNADDYIVMNPFNEVTEIVQVSSVNPTELVLVSAIQFNYSEKDRVYATPFNQMRFYSCATPDGTYVLITTVDITHDQPFTDYEYAAGTVDLYYKRTFYNESTTTESDIGLSDYFQTSIDNTYVTAEEMMIYLQLTNGVIELTDLREIIKLATLKITLDVPSSNVNILKIASFLLSKHLILNALAAKAIMTGYITATVEGRTVTKSHTELKKDAESAVVEYNEFLIANARTEVSKTGYMDEVSADTRQEIINIMTGSQDSLDFQNNYFYSYGIRGRRR